VNLTDLSLGGNRLQALPGTITLLTSLERLDLQENNLKILPADIAKLTKLQWLMLIKNPVTADEKERLKRALPRCHIAF
jgi:Leucine-rich repeat (LRR) protein